MTTKIKFCYYNLVDQSSTVISASNENSLFPTSNLKDPRKTKVFRSTNASDSVVFDFITAQAVDSIIVAGHPSDGFGFTGSLTIEANATNSWGAPAFSTTLTPNSEFNFGLKTLTAAQSYRYWRVTGTGSSYFELGKIFIGSYYQPSRNIGNSFSFENDDLSKVRENRYGQKFFDVIPSQKIIKGNVNLLDKTNVDAFFDFINYVGITKPFYCILNESEDIINEHERFSDMYFFKKRPVANHVIRGIYNFSVTLEEAK